MSEAAVPLAPTIAGCVPRSVLVPASVSELAEVLRDPALGPFVVTGGGTMLDRGRVPAAPFDLLDVRTALRGAIQHQRDDLTVVVPAGATIDEVNGHLAPSGQWIPLDPPRPSLATIGGTAALGINGPLRARYGLVRDLVIGMTVIRADGQLVKAGGRVVKNVTGYDLMRLWCGSLGTLGIITEVAMRALPRAATTTLVADATSAASVAAIARAMSTADVRPLYFDALLREDGWKILTSVVEVAADAAHALMPGAARAADTALYDESRDLGASEDDKVAVSVSTTLGGLAEIADEVVALEPHRCVLRPLAGVVRASWVAGSLLPPSTLRDAIARLRALLRPIQGSVIIDRMPPEYHAVIDAWDEPPTSFGVMQNVKAAYDPLGRINPGRFIGGI